jgi:DNA-binding winged helix-turn-helix (wHTH) protein/tetratricopeptide (TPR) repeat protein
MRVQGMVGRSIGQFSFAGFTLDLGSGRLLRGTDDVQLRAKSFALLAYMVSHAGRIVSKDDLMLALWPDVIVTEDSLTRCVHEVRRALGPDGPRLMRNIPRRGYLFTDGDLVVSTPAGPLAVQTIAETSPVTQQDAPVLRRDGIAVIQFEVETVTSPHDQDLLDGLAHDIIGRLARLRCFHVIARSSSFAFRGRSSDPQTVGQKLGVAYAVTGLARINGSSVTLRIELVNCEGGNILWTDDFTGTATCYGALLGGVVDRLILSIQREITDAERNRSLLVPLPSLDGWQAYHRGLFHMLQFEDSELQRAEGFFQLSIDRDPGFSRAHSAMSYCHFLEAFLRPVDQRGDKAYMALRSASRAMQLDDQSPASRWVYGRALWLGGDHGGGIREMRTSVEISPSFAMGYQSLSFFLFQSGTPDDTIDCAIKAESLSPFDPFLCAIYGARAMALWHLGDLEQAADFAIRAARQHNAHKHILAISGMVLTVVGRTEEANRCMDRVRGFDPRYSIGTFRDAFSGLSDDALSGVHKVAPRIGLS